AADPVAERGGHNLPQTGHRDATSARNPCVSSDKRTERDVNSAVKKGLVVVGVALVLLVPLAWLHGLVSERTALREQAISSVARGWGGRQLLAGPVLAIPVSMKLDDGRSQVRDWYVLPESLQLDVEVTVEAERRRLGVYEVPVYRATVHATGEFDFPRQLAKLTGGATLAQVHLDRARLFIPVSDLRGLREIKLGDPALTAGVFEPARGFPIAGLAALFRSDVNLSEGKQTFDLTLRVAGTQSLQFLPLAHTSRVQLRGNWPDPGFASGFLPAEHHMRGGAFDATWQVLDLNRLYGMSWLEGEISTGELQDSAFGVELVQPIDLYQQADRAVKYAGVFICLTFLTLFVWEHCVGRPVHPIQYALMGLALSVFFLLLLALAE